MKPSDEKFVAHPIPRDGAKRFGVVVAGSGKRDEVFVRFTSGDDPRVYVMGRTGTLDMLRDWATNASERSAFAQLAGLKVKEIDQARRARKVEKREDRAKEKVAELRRMAERAGFRLVKGAKK